MDKQKLIELITPHLIDGETIEDGNSFRNDPEKPEQHPLTIVGVVSSERATEIDDVVVNLAPQAGFKYSSALYQVSWKKHFMFFVAAEEE